MNIAILSLIVGTFAGGITFFGFQGIVTGDRSCAYILFVLLSGGFGGFVCSFSDSKSYSIRLPITGKKLHLGFIGNIIIGMLAGGTGLYFIGQMMDQDFWNLDLIQNSNIKHCFAVFTMSSVCGYLGIKLLSKIADKFFTQIVDDMNHLKRETAETAADELATRAKVCLLEGDPVGAIDFADNSIKIFENARAWGFKGNAYKMLNEYDQALASINRAIALNDQDRRRKAFYYWNRACYKSLLNEKLPSILADLKKSIELDQSLAGELLEDKDLNIARGHDNFFTELNIRKPE